MPSANPVTWPHQSQKQVIPLIWLIQISDLILQSIFKDKLFRTFFSKYWQGHIKQNTSNLCLHCLELQIIKSGTVYHQKQCLRLKGFFHLYLYPLLLPPLFHQQNVTYFPHVFKDLRTFQYSLKPSCKPSRTFERNLFFYFQTLSRIIFSWPLNHAQKYFAISPFYMNTIP